MSDLARLRRRLVSIERTGKRLKRELEDLKAQRLLEGGALTLTEERRITALDKEINDARRDWHTVWGLIGKEERRLLEDRDGFLRFT